ncbi:hypothetical protein EAS61_39710 [Bradyrhizobium zhanjiangense]|uniref:Uncharacterized protein n=1 Tax=Bradyrhizobium zhanjiangense TaxID=1325107 RepID=A0A4Q0Q5V5_9BRAD|nr:hypothetical protein EAS61_39710 [Bradyrhizobium zhanjiangense]RXG95556.1 hypothetical protein EAS62_13810 [Bradyrhizobium zhanjiangense]
MGRKAWRPVLAVIPRESGESSTPRPHRLITVVSAYWIARSSRAMTAEYTATTENVAPTPPRPRAWPASPALPSSRSAASVRGCRSRNWCRP